MLEYKKIYLNWGMSGIDADENIIMAESLEEQLNKYGADGWELVNLETWGRPCGNALFKRELKEESAS